MVFETLETYTTRWHWSSVASAIAGVGASSAKMSSSTTRKPWRSASSSSRLRDRQLGGRARRVLQRRVREQGADRAALERGLERGGVGPVREPRDADEAHATGTQQLERRRVARVLDRDPVAGLEQRAHDEVERLARALRQHELVRAEREPATAAAGSRSGAQRLEPERRAVTVVGQRQAREASQARADALAELPARPAASRRRRRRGSAARGPRGAAPRARPRTRRRAGAAAGPAARAATK